ncbi:hypothetical protein HK105_206653 [Polyrhizophydium stewartii]|uniref:Uncharacterized protein n=1 Tax=Polyrhizophydium stewartii TaxID=2732419 RepID=A0ABR4N347_9FUNG
MSPPHTPIPHIIHQSWKTVNLPVKFQKWQTSWRKHHPGWEYRLWTDDDNMRFCEEHYPWFLERFKSYPQNINRADAVRYMYLHKVRLSHATLLGHAECPATLTLASRTLQFGGVYADLDVECLKPHEPIAQLGGIVMPLMSYDYNFEHNIPNAWMASAPGHPFWIYLLERMNKMKLEGGVEAATGPVVLYRALREFETKLYNETMPPITYLSRELIFPYDWHNSQPYSTFCSSQSAFINTTRCKQTIDPDHRAYTITYWSHSWGDGDALISLPEGHHLTPKQIPQQ